MTRRLDNPTARRVFLDRHLLTAAPTGNAGRDALLDIIQHLGFVQLDSVNTLARAHDLILWSRQQSYRPPHLRRLADRDRALFEHWTHDAAILPMEHYPHWRLKFARDRAHLLDRWQSWRGAEFQARFREVLDHIADNGAVLSRELGGDAPKGSGWWEWHPSKTAMEYLWRSGELAVCHRRGFQKAYDLAERVIPAAHRTGEFAERDTIDWACRFALDRLGFATSGEIAAFFDLVTPQEAKDWVAATDLEPVEIEQADGRIRRSVALPGALDNVRDIPEPTTRVRILSPFDPALRDRNRAERLFGFHYRIEIFVPEAQRKYGYYVFPVLEGDRLIGRIDARTDRDTDSLAVRAFWPEAGVRMGQGRVRRLEAELDRIATFAGVGKVTMADGWLVTP